MAAVMSGITILLRALPLLLPRSLLRTRLMLHLNQQLPLCVMVILVLHAVAEPGTTFAPVAEILSLVVVGASYVRWRNALVSVVVGLAALALLSPLVPPGL